MKYNKYETEVVESTEFKAGDRVRVRGDASDCTDHLDGMIGTVVFVTPIDCIVDFGEAGDGEWYIWNHNMTLAGDA